MRRILTSIDLAALFIIAVGVIVLSALDYFDVSERSWMNYPVFTLALLALVCVHLIVTHVKRESFQEQTEAGLTMLLKRSPEFGCRVFSSSHEMETYLGQRILEARSTVRDLTWKKSISSGFSASQRQRAHKYMDECISDASDRIAYREIFVFSDSRRVDKLNRRLKENRGGYSCRYYRDDSVIPRLQFVLVDDEEAFLFASGPDAPLVACKSKELCAALKSHFEVAWTGALVIKEGPRVDQAEVDFVRALKF